MIFAPKGPNKSAQGNALGKQTEQPPPALKGRNKRWHRQQIHRLFRPFRAGRSSSPRPRALPWAGLFGPFGARKAGARPAKWRCTTNYLVSSAQRRIDADCSRSVPENTRLRSTSPTSHQNCITGQAAVTDDEEPTVRRSGRGRHRSPPEHGVNGRNIGPPRWGFRGLSRASSVPRPLAWAGMGPSLRDLEARVRPAKGTANRPKVRIWPLECCNSRRDGKCVERPCKSGRRIRRSADSWSVVIAVLHRTAMISPQLYGFGSAGRQASRAAGRVVEKKPKTLLAWRWPTTSRIRPTDGGQARHRTWSPHETRTYSASRYARLSVCLCTQ